MSQLWKNATLYNYCLTFVQLKKIVLNIVYNLQPLYFFAIY